MSSKDASDKNSKGIESDNMDSGFLSGPITDDKLYDSENADSGFLSGPITDYDKYEGSSEKQHPADLDSGVTSVKDSTVHTPTAQQQVPLQTPTIAVVQQPDNTELPPIAILYQQDDDGDTQLHITAVHGCEQSVATLIKICPNKLLLDIRNDFGQTALHLAASSGHALVTRMLVKAGANIAIRDVTGSTPLHMAAAHGHQQCVQALLAPVPELPARRMAPILNQMDYNGQMAVHVAASKGHVDALRTLVFYGADINERDGLSGWTALHIAAVRGDFTTAQFLVDKCPGVTVDALDWGSRQPARYARRNNARKAFVHKVDFDELSETEDEEDDEDDVSEMYERVRMDALVQGMNTVNVA